MNEEMKELAAWSVETAKSAGADNCRVSINSERLIEISYRDRKPENIKDSQQLFIRLMLGNCFCRCSATFDF